MAKLTTTNRNKLQKSTFGLPKERKYPMPDRSHAANAKARASQMVKKGKLSKSSEEKIDAKANKILYGSKENMRTKGTMMSNEKKIKKTTVKKEHGAKAVHHEVHHHHHEHHHEHHHKDGHHSKSKEHHKEHHKEKKHEKHEAKEMKHLKAMEKMHEKHKRHHGYH